MNISRIIIIDSDNLGIQPALATLKRDYPTEHIDQLAGLDLESMIDRKILVVIDPSAFQRQALPIYKQLLELGANVIVTAYPDESVVNEADCLSSGALDYLIKPISPSILKAFIEVRMSFINELSKYGCSTASYIAKRQSFDQWRPREFRIDLVEDSYQDANTLHTILEPECDIHWFKSATVFNERQEPDVPDLFVLDIVLDGVKEGYDLFKLIRSEERYDRVPIIFLTGSWQRKKIEDGIKLGATDYIRKVGMSEKAIRERIFTNLMLSTLTNNSEPSSNIVG